MTRYDAIIIGSGQGGVPLARALAESGKKTALIERQDLGGTCINYGCTPTKTLYNSARVAYLATRAADFGVVAPDVSVDMAVVRKRVSDMVADFRGSLERKLPKVENLTLVRGHGRFSGPATLRIDGTGEELTAPWIFIDSGTRPLIPPIPGLDTVPFLDNHKILDLARLPAHLVVLGGGYIGLEFAQIFRRLGSQVTVVGQGDRLLPHEDQDVAEAVAQVLTEDGIELVLNDEVVSASGEVNLNLRSGREISGSDLLVSVGRQPNTDDLGLDSAGVETDPRGLVKVDGHLRTTAKGVFAIGDVKGGPQFTHISYDDYRILFGNLVEGKDRTTCDRAVPYVMYLDPQLGRVGPNEAELTKRGIPYRVAKLPAEHIARAVEMGETRGFVKALVAKDSEQILSATTFCVEGGELLTPLQFAIEHRVPYTALRDATIAHPTMAECLNNLFGEL